MRRERSACSCTNTNGAAVVPLSPNPKPKPTSLNLCGHALERPYRARGDGMTTTHTDRRERALGHIASLMAVLRPGWDVAGCIAALRKLPDMPLIAVAFTALRYADDPTNETPTHIADLGNRAWQSFDPWPCKTHPRAGHRANGECGGCWADRIGVDNAAMSDRGGKPIPPGARRLIDEAITKRQAQHEVTA